MLTVRKLSLAQASTYYSKDNYYTQEQGEFHGKLKDELGLRDLTHESFTQLLQGINPSTGESLVSSKNGKEAAVPAFDFTFSPSKSVSIVYEAALAKGDMALASAMQNAHDNAVNMALSHIEQEEIKARVQKNGKRQSVNTGNLISAKFQHDINRALDPQLHTHSVIFNFTKCEDGKFRALDAAHLLKKGSPIIKNLGQFYRESLKEELQKAGFELRDTNKSESFYELKNVDDTLIEAFSSRNIAIKAKVEELKKEYPQLSKSQLSLRAFFNTRVSKKEVDRDEVRVKNVELMSQYTDVNKLLSSLKKEVQNKEIKNIPSERELLQLINLTKSQISNKRHRTPLNIANKVVSKLDSQISIQEIYSKTKNEEVKQQKEFKTMHEVLLHSLKSTKLDTHKLFESLKNPNIKIQIEEKFENERARTTSERERFAQSYSRVADQLERTKFSNYRDVEHIATTTAERGASRGDTERDGTFDIRATGINYPNITREELQRADRLNDERRAREQKREQGAEL